MASEHSATMLVDGERAHVALGWNIAWVLANKSDNEDEMPPRALLELRHLTSYRKGLSRRRKLQMLRLGRGEGFRCESKDEVRLLVEGERGDSTLSKSGRCEVMLELQTMEERDKWMRLVSFRVEEWPCLLQQQWAGSPLLKDEMLLGNEASLENTRISRREEEESEREGGSLFKRAAVKMGKASVGIGELDEHVEKSKEWTERLNSAVSGMGKAAERFEGMTKRTAQGSEMIEKAAKTVRVGAKWSQNIGKGLGSVTEILDFCVSQVPVVSGAITVAKVAGKAAERVGRARANEAKAIGLISRSQHLMRLLLYEMLIKSRPGDESQDAVRDLAAIIGRVEHVMRSLEEHLNRGSLSKFVKADVFDEFQSIICECEQELVGVLGTHCTLEDVEPSAIQNTAFHGETLKEGEFTIDGDGLQAGTMPQGCTSISWGHQRILFCCIGASILLTVYMFLRV